MLSGAEKRARLAKALEYGGCTHSVEDVVQLCQEGKARLWGDDGDGCIVTEIHAFPQRRAIHFWLISGTLRDCLALEHEILPWAIEEGCTVATACGRRGWGRVSAKTGWRPQPHMFNFYKPLVGGLHHG
jgi:hypothetical protein